MISTMEILAPGIATFDIEIPKIEDMFADLEKEIAAGSLKWEAAGIAQNGGASISTEVRDTYRIKVKNPKEGVEYESDLIKLLAHTFKDSFLKSITAYSEFYEFTVHEYGGYNILKYGIGQKFDRHRDDDYYLNRRVSLIYYVNDGYTGGEIEFDAFKLTIKPKKHQLLLFPSAYVYTHRIHPVTSGVRYSVVQWML